MSKKVRERPLFFLLIEKNILQWKLPVLYFASYRTPDIIRANG